MKYLPSNFFRLVYITGISAFACLLQGCPGPKEPSPVDNTTSIKPMKTNVSQLELVQLIVKDIKFSTSTITGTFGGKTINLSASNDTLTFLIPDVVAGLTTLTFKEGQKDYKVEYTVQEVKIPNVEVKIGEFTSNVDAQIAGLEQRLKIAGLPANGVLNNAEIAELKRSSAKLKEDLVKATANERTELAKFLTANPFVRDNLGAARVEATTGFSTTFLAAVKALLSQAGAKAILSGSAGYIVAAAGLGPVGWLIGAALMIHAVVTVKKAMYSIVELSHLGAESGDVLDPIWNQRVAVRSIERDRPYKINLSRKYRTLGKQDANNASLAELFSLNDKLYYVAEKLKTLKVLSGSIVNLREQVSSERLVSIPSKEIVSTTTGNAGVIISNSATSGDTLLLTFKSDSQKDEAFDLKLSYKAEDGQTLVSTESITLKAPVLNPLIVLPDLVNNYQLKGTASEQVSFSVKDGVSPVKWEVLNGKFNITTTGFQFLQAAGTISDKGVFSAGSNRSIIGPIRIKASSGARTGFATIMVNSCQIKFQVSSYVRLTPKPGEDYTQFISGGGIGKFLKVEERPTGEFYLYFEFNPKVGDQTIKLYNPYSVPIAIGVLETEGYRWPENVTGRFSRNEIESKASANVKCTMYEIVYE